MTNTTYLVVMRDGKKVLEGKFSVHADGTIWANNNTLPLLGHTDAMTKDDMVKAMKAKAWAKIPADAWMRVGLNPSGATVLTKEQYMLTDDYAQMMAETERIIEAEAKQVKIYLSARGWGDYSPCQWTGDITRPADEILAECRHLLATGHDVDNPNQTDDEIMALIATAKNAYDHRDDTTPKIKPGAGYCYSCESYCDGDCGDYRPHPDSVTHSRKQRDYNRQSVMDCGNDIG